MAFHGVLVCFLLLAVAIAAPIWPAQTLTFVLGMLAAATFELVSSSAPKRH
jgi:hypothetical protein